MTRPALAALLLAAPAAAGADFFPFFEPVRPPRPVQVMVHRGVATAAPENTRRAVEMCAEDYYEWAEVDVHLTKDGRHVLFHDGRLDGKTNGTGPVSAYSRDDLLALDAGRWFADRFAGEKLLTLADGLALAKDRINLYLDCKRVDPELLAREVVAAKMETQVVVYDRPDVIARVRAASTNAIPVMAKWRPAMGDPTGFAARHGLAAVEVDAPDATPDICRQFRAAGVKVQAKVLGATWDTPEVWRTTAAAGVDWLQTDRPLEVLTTLCRGRHATWPVKVAYHRGASRYAPENTLPAIRLAAALRADYVEIDVRTTTDGAAVLLHDQTLDRTTTGTGSVAGRTAAEVAAADAGRWFGRPYAGTTVPTLADALAAMGDAHCYLDCKDIAPDRLAAVLRERELTDRSVVYGSVGFLRAVKGRAPAARLLPPLRSAAALEAAADLNPYGVDAAWDALSKELIGRCHAKGIRVFSDALGRHETVEDYRRAIGWGVDVIQTDHPARVLRAVELHFAGGP